MANEQTPAAQPPQRDSAAPETTHPQPDTQKAITALHGPRKRQESASHAHGCRCGKRWGGTSTCHCATCHHTFSSITAFDRHRRSGQCLTPKQAGLVTTHRGDIEIIRNPGDRPHQPGEEDA